MKRRSESIKTELKYVGGMWADNMYVHDRIRFPSIQNPFEKRIWVNSKFNKTHDVLLPCFDEYAQSSSAKFHLNGFS